MAEKASTKQSAEERTRRLAEKPFEELDAAAGRGDDGPSLRGAARAAAVTALAAAVAGALGGAAKALLDRRDGDGADADEPDSAAARQADDEQAEDQQAENEPAEDGEPPAPAAEEDEVDREQAEDADAPLARDEHNEPGEQDEREEVRADHSERDQNGAEPESGAAANEVAEIVERAKQQLEDVLGAEAESVSGLERADGRWTVALEVVEVRRIPESTDVLASYEVVLDDDGGIVSMQKRHRYRRSQVEEER